MILLSFSSLCCWNIRLLRSRAAKSWSSCSKQYTIVLYWQQYFFSVTSDKIWTGTMSLYELLFSLFSHSHNAWCRVNGWLGWSHVFYCIWAVSVMAAVCAQTQTKHHHFWLLCNKWHIYIPLVLISSYILYIIFFLLVFVFFHFASYIFYGVLYLGSIPFTFHLLLFYVTCHIFH